MSYTTAVFARDALNGHFFHGVTAAGNRNELSCPLFPLEEGLRLATINNATGVCGVLAYDPGTDAFLYHHDSVDTEPVRYEATIVEGRRYYPIGTVGWTWHDASTDAVAQFSAALFTELNAMRNIGMRVPDQAFTLAATVSEVEDVMNMSRSDAADLLIQLADLRGE